MFFVDIKKGRGPVPARRPLSEQASEPVVIDLSAPTGGEISDVVACNETLEVCAASEDREADVDVVLPGTWTGGWWQGTG